MKINISKDGIIEYYGNEIGYVRDNKAVVDVMFQKDEIQGFLTEENGIAVDWREGIFGNIAIGRPEEILTTKNCRLYQLNSDADVRIKYIGYAELKEKGFSEPTVSNYKVTYDGNLGTEVLEEIYNALHDPDSVPGFDGNGIFISDVIELYDDNSSEFHYVDPYGFKKLEAFLEPKMELKEEIKTTEVKEPIREPKPEKEPEFKVIREKLDMGFGKKEQELKFSEPELDGQQQTNELQFEPLKFDM